jgi:hypothetical protein
MKVIYILMATLGCGLCTCALAAEPRTAEAPTKVADSGSNIKTAEEKPAAALHSEENADRDYSYEESRWTRDKKGGHSITRQPGRAGTLPGKAGHVGANPPGFQPAAHSFSKAAAIQRSTPHKPAFGNEHEPVLAGLTAHHHSLAVASYGSPSAAGRLEPSRTRNSGAAKLGGPTFSRTSYTASLNGTEMKHRPQ